MQHIKELYYDEPISYKDLTIFPVRMKDYLEFHYAVNCLLVEKNNIPDIKIISMSYLRALYYLAVNQNQPYLYMLRILFCLALRKPLDVEIKFYVDNSDKAFFEVEGIKYNASDFDEVAKIIMEQNSIKPIDYTVQKEIRDELEKAKKYRERINQNKMCSLEEQMICVLISTPLKLEDIYELTIRKFEKILSRVDAKLHYQIYKQASMSGFVEFKNKDAIAHWMSDLESKDPYKEEKMSLEEMQGKIDTANGIKNN